MGVLQSIWRYPIKGFTSELMGSVDLKTGAHVPYDRCFAVEDGPSGFDPAAPVHMSKQRFTVLAKTAAVARIRTAFDEASGILTAEAPGTAAFKGTLNDPDDAADFSAWLHSVLGDAARGPLKVLAAPCAHRFMDDPEGWVSIVNLASLGGVAARLGRPIDPLRLRANFYVEGWAPWAEDHWIDRTIQLGQARLTVVKTITRCAATHVDPSTGERDLDLVRALFEGFGHTHCGLYARVTDGGRVTAGDPADLIPHACATI